MSLVKTREQRKAIKSIDVLFRGLEDDVILKQALLTAYAGEDPSILEALKEQEQKEMEELLKQMELQRVEDVFVEPVTEEKSNDIVDGNDTSLTTIDQGHISATLEQSN